MYSGDDDGCSFSPRAFSSSPHGEFLLEIRPRAGVYFFPVSGAFLEPPGSSQHLNAARRGGFPRTARTKREAPGWAGLLENDAFVATAGACVQPDFPTRRFPRNAPLGKLAAGQAPEYSPPANRKTLWGPPRVFTTAITPRPPDSVGSSRGAAPGRLCEEESG